MAHYGLKSKKVIKYKKEQNANADASSPVVFV